MNYISFPKTYSPILIILFLICNVHLNAQNGKPARDSLRYKNNLVYEQEIAMYDIYKIRQADIVMLGNSLTHGAAWNELLGRPDVVERGIPGDGLDGFAARINYVYKLRPKIVFIEGGVNDVYNWEPVEDIFHTYVRIIIELKGHNIIPVIQSTTYASKNYGASYGLKPESNFGRNREIDKLNQLLSDYAKRNNIDYINLIPQLSTKDGFMRPELTVDGIHFKASAFKIWANEVEKVLAKHRI